MNVVVVVVKGVSRLIVPIFSLCVEKESSVYYYYYYLCPHSHTVLIIIC